MRKRHFRWDVTKDHWEQGIPGNPLRCAVRKAAAAVGLKNAEVTKRTIRFSSDGYTFWYKTPDDVRDEIILFDIYKRGLDEGRLNQAKYDILTRDVGPIANKPITVTLYDTDLIKSEETGSQVRNPNPKRTPGRSVSRKKRSERV